MKYKTETKEEIEISVTCTENERSMQRLYMQNNNK